MKILAFKVITFIFTELSFEQSKQIKVQLSRNQTIISQFQFCFVPFDPFVFCGISGTNPH